MRTAPPRAGKRCSSGPQAEYRVSWSHVRARGCGRVEHTALGDATGAAAFRVVHDHVTSVFRHPDLESALAATELTEDDLDA